MYADLKAALAMEIPTRIEVYAMAKYLGLVPELEPRRMWIALQATVAPCPAGWTEVPEEGAASTYYVELATRHTTRTHPLDAMFKQVRAHVCLSVCEPLSVNVDRSLTILSR